MFGNKICTLTGQTIRFHYLPMSRGILSEGYSSCFPRWLLPFSSAQELQLRQEIISVGSGDHDLSHYDYWRDHADMGHFHIHDSKHLHGDLFATRCVTKMASSRLGGIQMVCFLGDRKTMKTAERVHRPDPYKLALGRLKHPDRQLPGAGHTGCSAENNHLPLKTRSQRMNCRKRCDR